MEDQKSQMVDVIEETPRLEYIIDDINNPNAVIHLVSEIPTLYAAIKRVIIEAPDLLAMDESTLLNHTHPTVTLSRLRMSFWTEYDNAASSGRKMKGSQVFGGIVTNANFRVMIKDNNKVAYLLCPPTNYVVQMKEALNAGAELIRQMFTAKIIDDDGNLMPRAADVVLKAFALLDMRVKGAIVQKVDQRTLSYNVNRDVTPNQGLAMPKTLAELQAQLLLVQQQLESSSVKTITQDEVMDLKSAHPQLERVNQHTGGYRVKPKDE